MKTRYIVLSLLLMLAVFLAFGAKPARGQAAESDKVILLLNRIHTKQYPDNFLNVTIIGKEGKPLEGLTEENFVVYEGEKKQKVLRVVQSDEKGETIYIVLVIDTSGSMTAAMENLKEAGVAFLDNLSPNDQVAVLSFSHLSVLECNFTSDKSTLESAIGKLKAGGGTTLYTAVSRALDLFDDVEGGNRAIVAITDGVSADRGLMEQVIRKSQEKGVPVFTVGLGSQVDQASLGQFAGQTGGMFRYAPDSGDLKDIYESLAKQLKKQYWVEYRATPQKWPKSIGEASIRLNKVPGGDGLSSTLHYMVPLQWWKIITAYVLIELAFILLMYLLFQLFWRRMGMDPVFATRLSIIILIVLTLAWYVFLFFRYVPVDFKLQYFALIGLAQMILLIIPIKVLAK